MFISTRTSSGAMRGKGCGSGQECYHIPSKSEDLKDVIMRESNTLQAINFSIITVKHMGAFPQTSLVRRHVIIIKVTGKCHVHLG